MERRRHLALTLGIIVAYLGTPVSQAAPLPIATPPYPEPPQQRAAWTAPPGADGKLAAAARRLFDEGLADPRGCDYREVELEVGEGWEDAVTPVKTHGWVLPGAAADPRFAVAWNGLVYRARSVGGPASVTADARAALDVDRRERDQARRDNPASSFARFPVASEGHYVALETVTPAKALLLLRLGEGALAARVWTAASSGQDPYTLGAEDWLWAQFVRGVTAHQRGDVALAIESWRRLPALAAAARAEVKGSGIGAGDPGVPYLVEIAELLADEQRRAAQPAPPLVVGALAGQPPSARIAKLIGALDQVAGRRFGPEDPIIEALVQEGAPAVEPLLVAYETDERRTRSRFVDVKHGDSDRWRHIYAVHEVAYTTIARLVDLSSFQPSGTGAPPRTRAERRARADELRAYLRKWRGVTPVERQYRVLADDALDEGQWLGAALQLTATAPGGAGDQPRLVGEALRSKASPSVSELFARRLAGFAELRTRAQLLQAFAAWDPAAARPALAATVRAAFAAWPTLPNRSMTPYLGEALAALTTARIACGDPAAIADYAGWLATTELADAQFAALRWLAPLIAHRDDPAIARVAAALFGARSGWVPLLETRNGFWGLELIGSDLLDVPAFRAHVRGQLANHAPLGTLRVRHGDVNVVTDAFQTGEGLDAGDPLLPKEGTTFALRVADHYAASLRGRPGAPKYRRYWPLAERDRALAALVAWLAPRP